jgi:hypothetical protein
MTGDQGKYAQKIAALLRKAESTNSPQEAEALTDKAQELMTRYAIESGMLEAHKDSEREEIVERTIDYGGLYSVALRGIGSTVARKNGCKILVSKGYGRGPSGGDTARLHVIGFESDVERVIVLDASVQIQAVIALRKWSKDNLQDWMSRQQKSHSKRDFYFGFAQGLGQRLQNAQEVSQAAVVEEMAEAQSETVQATSESVGLMIRSRKERIEDWTDSRYGQLRSVRSRSYQSGGAGGWTAGHRAGTQANTGSSGALKNRKALAS